MCVVSLCIGPSQWPNPFLSRYPNKRSSKFAALPELIRSRVYSETDGSLAIEMAPTTRKRIQELASGFRQPMVRDDHLIASMVAGIDFVMGNPPFNEENLFKLYSLLSHDGLDPDCQLKKGRKYRDGEVGIDNYPGCPTDSIVPCTDSLFAFAGEVLGGQDAELRFFATYRPLLPRLWPTLF